MLKFFEPASNDTSLEYLGTIFGNMGGLIPHGSVVGIFGTMFRTFNSIALAIGALIIVYITVVGVMMTAHEGEFMKKWNSLWTPIRAVVGIASLVPTASGFSGLQIIMMWVIIQGIGAADNLWNTVLGYVNYAGSVYAQVGPPLIGTSATLGDIFKEITCEESAKVRSAPPFSANRGGYYCNSNSSNAWCSLPETNVVPGQTSKNSMSFGPAASCGTFTYCKQTDTGQNGGDCVNNPGDVKCLMCKAQVEAMSRIVPIFREIARIYVKADYDYQNFYANGYTGPTTPNPDVPRPAWVREYCNANNIQPNDCRGPVLPLNLFGGANIVIPGLTGSLPSPASGNSNAPKEVIRDVYWPYAVQPEIGSDDFIASAVNEYGNAIGAVISQYIANQIAGGELTNADLQAAKKTGWVFAGAYYYTLTKGNNDNIQNSPSLAVNPVNPNASETPNMLASYRNNFTAAKDLISAMGNEMGAGGNEALESLGAAGSTFSTTLVSATKPSESNPLVQLATAGYWLLFSAQIVFLAFFIAAIAIGLISGINIFALGNGGFNPMVASTPIIYMILVPLFFFILGLMVSLGATLGVYVPLIPYIIFTFGVIGWFTSVIEAMVAGPLVALGILAPGGHHEMLGKAEPALMLLFNVFIRPSLMIFGLIAAMLLATVAVDMINKMFWNVVFQIMGVAGGTGASDTQAAGKAAMAFNPLEGAFFLIAYVGLIISALNKCFAAIHLIPERVVAWIGGQGAQYGEGEAVSEMKRGVEGGAHTAAGGMKEGTSKVGTGAATKGEAKIEANKAKLAKKTPPGGASPPSSS